MSTDYDLVCTQCRKRVETVASASISYGDKLWRSPEAMDALRDFLFAHKGHPLVFDDFQALEEFEEEPAPQLGAHGNPAHQNVLK